MYIERSELHAFLAELVDGGCGNVCGTKAAEVAITLIVCEDKDDIRLVCLLAGSPSLIACIDSHRQGRSGIKAPLEKLAS